MASLMLAVMTSRPLPFAEPFRVPDDPEHWDWRDLWTFCRAIARRQANSEELAEDAAQEALVRAWRSRAQCRGRSDPRPWIAAIVRREVGRLAGGRHAEVLIAHVPESLVECDGLRGADDRTSLDSAVADLAMGERRVLLLRYVADMTQPQIADVLNIPEGTVKIRLHRARARLRSVLEADLAA
jgi:RNA polymerase sigma-70 factor (ECF subfamily)